MRRSSGGGGSGSEHPEKLQKYRVSSQYWGRSPKTDKITKPAFNAGSFHWHADDDPFIVLFGSSHKKTLQSLTYCKTFLSCALC